MAKSASCPVGFRDITRTIRAADVTWSGPYPEGNLARVLAEEGIAGAREVLHDRVDSLDVTGSTNERLHALIDRIRGLDLNFRHQGPGLAGDNYKVRVCAKFGK